VAEVWCPMTSEFYAEYLIAGSRRQQILAVLNPNKCYAMDFLLKKHADDKVIVFSESIVALKFFAEAYGRPFLCGDTAPDERAAAIRAFRDGNIINTLFLSKVGDVALDVPDANVLIQISSHGGSRLQEAQRMGRILRKKKTKTRNADGFDAYFYTLLSLDTSEMFFSEKRRRYLVAQGYEYHVISVFPPISGTSTSERPLVAGEDYLGTEEELQAASECMKTREARSAALAKALSSEGDEQEAKEDSAYKGQDGLLGADDEFLRADDAVVRQPARRTVGTLDKLTTQANVRYLEVEAAPARR